MDNHTKIEGKIVEKGLDPTEILKINNLNDFSSCVLGKNDSIRNEKGWILKGISGNPTGRTKESIVEEREDNKKMRSFIQEQKESIIEHYKEAINVHPILKFAVALLDTHKTTYQMDDWLNRYMKYFVGVKQSIESTHQERKEIIIKIGDDKTTALFHQMQNNLKDITPKIKELKHEDK